MNRFSLASLLALVGFIAVGLAALRDASEWVAQAFFTLTLAALAFGLLGTIVRREHAAWIGFSLFGWGYFLAAFAPVLEVEIAPFLLTTKAIDTALERLNEVPPLPPELGYPTSLRNDVPSTKFVEGKWIPLSPSEIELVKDYLDKMRTRELHLGQLETSFQHGRRIGHSMLSLIAGLLGAFAGRLFARERTPAEAEAC